MKTNKNLSEDKLQELFNKIPVEEPTPDFMENLLLRIEKEALREKKRQQWITAGQIAASLSGILILPALAVYLCTIFLPGFSFSFPKIHLHFDPKLVAIGFSILMLLILDTLFRMHAANRSKRD
ncbi:MAG: hypothetical protein FWF53_04125 [Candidatus Azobacteroides sp.]|nr:hypothetical protein [Candidatus Azobacteroides sp.]